LDTRSFIGIRLAVEEVLKKHGQIEALSGLVQVEEKRRRAAPVSKSMKKWSSQTAASKQRPKQ